MIWGYRVDTIMGFNIWLVVWNMNSFFPFSWECHNPNWLSCFSGLKPPTFECLNGKFIYLINWCYYTMENHWTISVWVNYNDLTATEACNNAQFLGNHPKMAARFRLVNYYNFPDQAWVLNGVNGKIIYTVHCHAFDCQRNGVFLGVCA